MRSSNQKHHFNNTPCRIMTNIYCFRDLQALTCHELLMSARDVIANMIERYGLEIGQPQCKLNLIFS